jgi:ribosomal protein S18 acetylase RimI-like enzyme
VVFLTIVHADASHLDAAWAIIDRCRTALRERGIEQWDLVYPTRETVANDIANGRLYVVTDGSVCQATVALDTRQEPEYVAVPWNTSEPALVVHRLCVDPAMQGRGLGAQVMDFVESYAREQGYASIRLDAYSGNPDAVAFYRRRGYREAGQIFFPRRPLPFPCFERAT